jgi:hypothetical protein
MIGILIAVLLAALAYAACVALGLPSLVALVAALLVLIAGNPAPARDPGGPGRSRRA